MIFFSNNLPKQLVIEIGLYLVGSLSSPLFLKIAETLANFHWYGTCPNCRDLLKSKVNGFTKSYPKVLISFGLISSGPPGLLTFRLSN